MVGHGSNYCDYGWGSVGYTMCVCGVYVVSRLRCIASWVGACEAGIVRGWSHYVHKEQIRWRPRPAPYIHTSYYIISAIIVAYRSCTCSNESDDRMAIMSAALSFTAAAPILATIAHTSTIDWSFGTDHKLVGHGSNYCDYGWGSVGYTMCVCVVYTTFRGFAV